MWIIGHSALAYLLVKLIYVCWRKELSPRLVIFVLIFANILDSLHYRALREITHNLIGAIIYSGIWIIIFIKLSVVYKTEVIILLLAMSTHILGDILVGGFCLFCPFYTKIYSINYFNSIEHLSIGILITLLFIIVIISSKDYQRLKIYLNVKKQEIFKSFERISLFQVDVVIMSLFIIYYMFLLVQFPLALIYTRHRIMLGTYNFVLGTFYFLLFIGYVCIFSILIINTFFIKNKSILKISMEISWIIHPFLPKRLNSLMLRILKGVKKLNI